VGKDIYAEVLARAQRAEARKARERRAKRRGGAPAKKRGPQRATAKSRRVRALDERGNTIYLDVVSEHAAPKPRAAPRPLAVKKMGTRAVRDEQHKAKPPKSGWRYFCASYTKGKNLCVPMSDDAVSQLMDEAERRGEIMGMPLSWWHSNSLDGDGGRD
jgi:hypothetical protein